jgi:hypothetical protein
MENEHNTEYLACPGLGDQCCSEHAEEWDQAGGLNDGEAKPYYDGWFTRYHPSKKNPEVVTTLWEFGVDGLTEYEAVELDRQFQTLVAEVEQRHNDDMVLVSSAESVAALERLAEITRTHHTCVAAEYDSAGGVISAPGNYS